MAATTSTRDRVKRGKKALSKPPEKASDVKRPQRVTRSQSREPVSAPPSRSNPRRGKEPSVELGAKDDSGAENAKKGGRKKRKRQQSPVSELPTVSEEPARKSPRRDSPDSIPETCDNQQFAQETADDHANISGTTILANDSFDGSESLDPPLMLEVLPELLQASNNLLNFLTPPKLPEKDFSEWIFRFGQGKLSTREQHRLSHRMSVFETNKKCFGSHLFIDIPSVIRALTTNSHADDIQHLNPLESVLHKANLASLASSMAHLTRRQALGKFLFELYSMFPLPFMGATPSQKNEELTTAQVQFLRRTFELMLDIRTHYLILSLGSRFTDNAFDSRITQAEDLPSLPTRCADRQLIKEWVLAHFKDEHNMPLPDEDKENLCQRTRTIQQSFRTDGVTEAALHRLQDTFPWRDFVTKLALWVRVRTQIIDGSGDLQDSVDDIIHRLEQELDSQTHSMKPYEAVGSPQQDQGSTNEGGKNGEVVPEGNPSNPPEPKDSQRHTHNWAMLNVSSMRLLKQREEKKDELPREADLQTAEGPRSREPSPADTWVTSEGNSQPEAEKPPPAKNGLRGAGQKEIKAGSSGKLAPTNEKTRKLGPAFIDAQKDARRVSPITLEDSARSQKPQRRLPETFDLEESREGSESDGYQQDDRQIDIEQSRKKKPKMTAPSGKQRAPSANLPSEDARQHDNSRPIGRSDLPDVDNQSASSFAPDDASDHEGAQSEEPTDFRSRETKQPTAIRRKTPSTPQRRRRWTDDETHRLAKLIVKYGTSWAFIKEKDEAYASRGGEPKLTGRSQVQLKDKARNLVIAYYKGGTPLPKNFDKITLSQSQKDQLAGMGIEGSWE